MAFFGVTKEVVEKVWPHPNADRLEIAKLRGLSFQFIVGKGLWKEGDECLYFPVDSLFPDDLLLQMGVGTIERRDRESPCEDTGMTEDIWVEGKLSGPNKNRLKTIRLRGEISQGMIGPVSLIVPDLESEFGEGLDVDDHTPEKITKYLGVQKYEPPVIFDANADLIPLPDELSMYDIEGADRYEQAVEALLDVPVAITEKVEGMNFSVYVNESGETRVNQRRFSIRPREGVEHSFWKLAESKGLLKIAEEIRQRYSAQSCAIYGEFLGPSIQKNIYGFKDHKVLVFDILLTGNVDNGEDDGSTRVDRYFLPWKKFVECVEDYGLESVPVLSEGVTLREVLGDQTVQEYSNGKSALFGTRREGIVIKPEEEKHNESLGGRLVLKQRSPDYLAKSEH